MQTSAPPQTFMRVMDKFSAALDQEYPDLSAGAMLLYLKLFQLSGHRDVCAPSLPALARACMISKRLAQRYLRQLVSLGYIRIERDGTRSVYHLLLSARCFATNGVAL